MRTSVVNNGAAVPVCWALAGYGSVCCIAFWLAACLGEGGGLVGLGLVAIYSLSLIFMSFLNSFPHACPDLKSKKLCL